MERAQRAQRAPLACIQVEHQQAAGGAQARHSLAHHFQPGWRHRSVAVQQVPAGLALRARERPVRSELSLQDARIFLSCWPSSIEFALW